MTWNSFKVREKIRRIKTTKLKSGVREYGCARAEGKSDSFVSRSTLTLALSDLICFHQLNKFEKSLNLRSERKHTKNKSIIVHAENSFFENY